MPYIPSPLNSNTIQLSGDILELTELLSKNTHEVWAQQRIRDGWKYGPVRDDGKKEHPDLIPYEELPEGEKEYDRQTAMETLKAIVALGYRIEKS